MARLNGDCDCNGWRCERCGPALVSRTRARLHAWADALGWRWVPMLTVRLSRRGFVGPGARGDHRRALAAVVSEAFRLHRRRVGRLEYVWVQEPHGDGFAHVHALVACRDAAGLARLVEEIAERRGLDADAHVVNVQPHRTANYLTKTRARVGLRTRKVSGSKLWASLARRFGRRRTVGRSAALG